MTWTKVDADVALEVASHEALVRQTYKDSIGKLTWCVGMTNATGHRVERYIGKPATLQHCMNVYAWALANYADGVREAFKGHSLTKAQFAAALSFHWNTGAIKRASWVKHFKAGDMKAARKAIMNWKTPPEIESRRKAERALFFDGVWSNGGTMPEYTRLTSRMTPVWSSRVDTPVAAELRKAFEANRQPEVDQAPQPEAPVDVPTLSPAPTSPDTPQTLPTGRKINPWAPIAAIIAGMAAAAYAYLKNIGVLP